MAKTYFNSAMTGNSGMLCCLSDRGELVRMFWPYIDHLQRTGSFGAGLFLKGEDPDTRWFHSDFGGYRQRYSEDTNIVRTTYSGFGLDIAQTDFVLPDRDVLVRRFDITACENCKKDMEMLVYSSAAGVDPGPHGMLFDFDADAIAHYRHSSFIYIGADTEIRNFQIGNNAQKCSASNNFGGTDDIGMMDDGAVSFSLGDLQPGQTTGATLYICAAETQNESRMLLRNVRSQGFEELSEHTRDYWVKKLAGANNFSFSDTRIQALYKRSILLFHLMADKNTGGLLASAEIDEYHEKCGGYGFCWGRDAAFITPALDLCGLDEKSEMFYRWAAKIQDEQGFWHQRYCIDGSLAPSWGLQIDETGSIVWGVLQHYLNTKDLKFLSEMWICVEKALRFLLKFIDPENGLPKHSFDLWEERFGIHAYSAAAVYGGLKAGAEIAAILGKSGNLADTCKEAAGQIKEALVSMMWNKEQKRFLRSIKTKLNPWGPEPSERKTMIQDKPKGNCFKEVTLEDPTVDASLIGLSVPFELMDAGDEKMRGTVEQIESNLSFSKGGLGRYENDGYIGGNPWIITTLWASIYHIETKEYDKALRYFSWVLDKTTETGLLPEQVGKESGKPAWVYGLTWSHSMFILALFKLMEAGLIDFIKKP